MLEVAPDSPLRQATLEIERHVAAGGWEQPPRLFALVRTSELIAAQPTLAGQLGDRNGYTPVEQDAVPAGRTVEEVLPTLMWPGTVHGCAVAIERIMLPPSAQADLPEEPEKLLSVVAEHPERQEVRIVAAVLRDGSAHTTVRARAPHDAPLLEGPDLVPGLVALLNASMS
ncbi:PPA1309 family protein [uncultured Aeromicrobium sp.]|uniref:PPA1309 family protein n=1 Tax=uncultured Aeromicrobium sp. TaxID=337820 RepID=UPI0025CF21F1|nr:PPA1309 family protein [uncultured Aeromicrobium sp.]